MNKKKNNVYEAPALTVVTFKTERGFALSLSFENKECITNDVMETQRQNYGEANEQTWF